MADDGRVLSATYVRDALDYDSATGLFTWRTREDRPRKWNSRWAGKRAGSMQDGYNVIQLSPGKNYRAARLAWLLMTGKWPPMNLQVDHRDLNRANDRWLNLRLATFGQNNSNCGPQRNNTSGFRGITLHRPTGKWQARIKSGIQEWSELFATKEEAVVARSEKAKDFHGEFAHRA